MDFLRLYQHLLPTGRAWVTTTDKNLRRLFAGLADSASDVKTAADVLWSDLFPTSTTLLDDWEQQFGLPPNVVTESARRLRLAATWRSLVGGQSPRYIEDTLRSAGFDVYVHEWWSPSTPPIPGIPARSMSQIQCGEIGAECGEPSAVCSVFVYPEARDPLVYLRREYTLLSWLVSCGEAWAACGEIVAQCGNSDEPRGYPLVNKIRKSEPNYLIACGEVGAECGEIGAECGAYVDFIETYRSYIVPRDYAARPYFLYIGGAQFGTLAQVDPKRRDEFEALCLKICPAHLWLGMLVEYV